jgi:hypothetical protein
MEYGLFWIGGAALVAMLANGRGRSGGGWFALSLLISPLLAGLFVLVLPTLGTTYEQIAAIAAVESLPPDSQARRLLEAKLPPPKAKFTYGNYGDVQGVIGLVLVAIMVVVLGAGFIAIAVQNTHSTGASAPVITAPAAGSERGGPMICSVTSCSTIPQESYP